jgi:EAL domain-containing protein (putative c-di-GMP-specific phosphodiesterase class I)
MPGASPSSPPPTQSIVDIIASGSIVTHFQPILSARQKSIVGLEALARGTALDPDPLVPPMRLFAMANQAGVTERLDSLCRRRAVRDFSAMRARARDRILFLNLHVPVAQAPGRMADELDNLVASFELPPNQVALEILEAEIEDMPFVQSLVNILRRSGFLIVLDDVGTGHSNLDRIPIIKPDLIKIDRTLVAHIDADYHKQGAVKSLVDLGRKIGAVVVAEGVEHESEAIVALELGADFLQGYFLGRPREPNAFDDQQAADALARIGSLATQFRRHMVDKITSRRLQHRRFGVVMNQILCDLAQARPDEYDQILGAVIGRYPTVECVYVLDHAGIQVSETVWNPSIRRRESGVMFRPAPKGTDHSLKEYYYVLQDVELHKYTTDPYVSLASGNISRTISTYFRDTQESQTYVLCIDVLCD